MNDDLASVPVPAGQGRFSIRWARVSNALSYVLCRLRGPVSPENARALASGGMDLLMERWAVPATVCSVSEEAGDWPHRMVLVRTGSGLVPVDVEIGPVSPGDLPLDELGPPVSSWGAAPRAGTPPEEEEKSPVSYGQRASRTGVLEEPGAAGRKKPGFVERGLTIRHGPGEDPGRALPTPSEAFDGIRPRGAAGSRLPALDTYRAEDPGDPPGGPPLWAVVASPELLENPRVARLALRALRGCYKVAVAGTRDRGTLERRLEQAGVPVDEIAALPSDSPRLAGALRCHPSQMLVFVLEDGAAPPGTIRIEVTRDGFAGEAARCCEE